MPNIAFKHKIQKSLRRKLLLPLILVGLVLTAGVIVFAHLRFQQLLVEKLAVRAELLANTVNYAAESLSRAGELQRIVTTLGAEKEVNLILVVAGTQPERIVAANKTALLGKTLENLGDSEIEAHIQGTLNSQIKVAYFDEDSRSYEIAIPLLISQPRLFDEKTLIQAVVFVQLDGRPTERDALKTIVQFMGLFLSVFLILVFYSYGLLRYYVVMPIAQIIHQISDGQKIERNKNNAKNYDEISLLGDTLSEAFSQTAQAYQELEARQQECDLLLKILEDTPDFIGMSDIQANVKYLNPAAKRMVGLPEDVDISTLKINDMHPEWASNLVLNEGIPEILKNGFWTSENVLLNKVTNTEIPVSQIGTLHYDEYGEPKLISTIMRDITENKKSERKLLENKLKLRQSEAFISSVLDSLTSHIAVLDKQGIIVSVNKAWQQFGESNSLSKSNNQIGLNYLNVCNRCIDIYEIENDEVKTIYDGILQVLNGETNYFCCEYPCHSESEKRWFLMSVSPLQGESGGVVISHENITNRKEIELELARSNADLEQFAYAVSHDMRQPLRMVMSYLKLVETALQNQLDDETRQFLHFAVDGAKRMDGMILSLLDYSRMGRATNVSELISSQNALDEALQFLQPTLHSSGGKIDVQGDWIDVLANRDELTRLLQNLIGNALKYHAENEPPLVQILAIATQNTFRVEIKDSGIGIEPSQIERLFKVFSRLQTQSRFEGTGVGLALCRKIVEHHCGTIGVLSQGKGNGCTFWFELPRSPLSFPPKTEEA